MAARQDPQQFKNRTLRLSGWVVAGALARSGQSPRSIAGSALAATWRRRNLRCRHCTAPRVETHSHRSGGLSPPGHLACWLVCEQRPPATGAHFPPRANREHRCVIASVKIGKLRKDRISGVIAAILKRRSLATDTDWYKTTRPSAGGSTAGTLPRLPGLVPGVAADATAVTPPTVDRQHDGRLHRCGRLPLRQYAPG